MKNTILALLFTFTTSTICNAQKTEFEKVFGGYLQTQNGNINAIGALVKAIEFYFDTLKFMKKAT